MKDLLFRLCSVNGVSGSEENIASLVCKIMSKYADTKMLENGSVISTLGNKNSRKNILLDAHIDQIGMIVTDIDKNGFIKMAPCGGIDLRCLPGHRVKIIGKKTIDGIVGFVPSYVSGKNNNGKFESIDNMYIDTGLEPQYVKTYVSPGDCIAFNTQSKELINNRVTAQSTDNRAGVSVLIKLAERLSVQDIRVNVTFLFSCQEEVGTRGAKISAYQIDANEAIAVDVSFANQPGLNKTIHCELGKGPMICICPTLSKDVTDLLIDTAKQKSLPFQLEVEGYSSGTNADSISLSRGGIKCGLVSIPQRYMHTPSEVISQEDLENTVNLLEAYIKKGGVKV